MKAITYQKYGSPDVLEYTDVPTPTPLSGQLLVRVKAASVNPYEWHFVRGKPVFMRLMGTGFLRPKYNILGADFAGVVESVGPDTEGFVPGDEVYGSSTMGNGLGAYAEYLAIGPGRIARKPSNISFEEAAAVPMAACSALQGLRDEFTIQPGHKVLVNGASGGIGTYGVQIAKALGAEVTGVCSTSKMDLVKQAGADHVIDYTQDDVTLLGVKYDHILDTAIYRSAMEYTRILNPGGQLAIVGGSVFRSLQAGLLKRRFTKDGRFSMYSVSTRINTEELDYLNTLLESSQMRSFIDQVYPLSEAAAAVRHVEDGRVRGKVVLSIS